MGKRGGERERERERERESEREGGRGGKELKKRKKDKAHLKEDNLIVNAQSFLSGFNCINICAVADCTGRIGTTDKSE